MTNWKLKVKIVERFKTQWRFAQHLGVDSAEVSRVVIGAREISETKKEKWAKELDSTSKELFG